ncbi:MAG: pyridoxamine 5'-phosphate oxidase family protein [Candidatus Schekmanbacteria bacterium]|nr:MAG: pyridoxamine 5'-phosphate oxidase family protein [Candidatus Schekmanbacteria bacterium]
MGIVKLTEEMKRELMDSYVRGLGLEPKHLSKEEAEKEIIDFLNKHNTCVLATCGKDGKPRSTVVDYENDGMTVYIVTEGGGKIDNILENPNVSLGIYVPHKTMKGVMGLNYQGKAEIFTMEDKEEMSKILPLFREVMENFKKEVKNITPRPEIMKVIKITPERVVFICYGRGIAEAVWTK